MHICKCNNCDSFLWDKNPKSSAVEIVGNLPFQVAKMVYNQAHVCPNCNTDEYLTDLSPEVILPKAYYRLADNQTGGYLASSCNAVGLAAWAKEFLEYHCSDLCDDDQDLVEKLYALSPEEVIEVAHEAGFSLQMSQYPFESDWFLDKIPVHLIQKMWITADGEICVQLNNCTIFTTKEDINFIDGNAISNFF